MESLFMRVPAEIRLMIYSELFDCDITETKSGRKTLSIRNGEANSLPGTATRTRTRYYVMSRSLHRLCFETTYRLTTKSANFCAALMRVNRAVYNETSQLVYGKHVFDFGSDAEAVRPFLSDLTPASRRLVTHIELYRRGPSHIDKESDRFEWRAMCAYLRDHISLEHLRLVVQAGRPAGPWDGPRELSSADLELLAGVHVDVLDWVADIARLKGLRDIEIVPAYCFSPQPQTTNMLVFAALSASIETGFTEFMRAQLGLALK
ncbi:hypothetical protein F5Y19DRAFT_475721 [Xylariaceae sp. FL1651]|nr:hypothetical protein F5Y19DRAFT_475721 [Xylariaceae sp. FL1651]